MQGNKKVDKKKIEAHIKTIIPYESNQCFDLIKSFAENDFLLEAKL